MKVVIATGNKGKVLEFNEGLVGLDWQLLSMNDFVGLELPEETGSTFEENAALKACFVANTTGLVALADDSGLEVEALGGEPGVYSARFGGLGNDTERNVYLLERIKDVPEPRVAKFVSVLVLAYPDGHLESYRGEVAGELLHGPRGTLGFGYDPLFLHVGLGKTFAELSIAEKRAISHRGNALAALKEAHRHGPPKREVSKLE